MMKRLTRRLLISLRGTRSFRYPGIPMNMEDGTAVQDCIRQKLSDEKPCMIARFGSVELQSVVDCLCQPTIKNAIQFVRGQIPSWGYSPSTIRTMHINAGFFPSTPEMLNRFGQLMLECMPMIDILGGWRKEEAYVMQYMPHALRVPLYTLEPYYFDQPWTSILEGKRVLVIHPFEDTIRKQHQSGRYEHLFADKRLTPNYYLQTIKAVQSIAGNKPARFDDWFQALDWMKSEIDKRDFDIAIIGCGAYGMPLAAHVRKGGRKAIHLGGAVQYLFGITSQAGNNNIVLSKHINKYWVRPSASETPDNKNIIENSRYW